MCGIAGILSGEPDRDAGRLVLRATRALAHRGPDGEGFWRATRGGGGALCEAEDLDLPATLVLGHRRLSIVDLALGAQPMGNEDGSVWVAFNGEIYNHRQLRTELEGQGHRFSTRCDTEVLVHGWEEWKEDLFGRLNGIFAFALVDTAADEVVLVRDPVGVKPLYVGTSGRRTWWCSELGAASSAGLVTGEVAPDALKLFLTFRFIPSPHAIFAQTWKVPPGHFVRLRAANAGEPPTFRQYENNVRSSADPRSRSEWRDALVAALEDAVDRQLMSDVPVASLLSGGVDSSLVTQLMVDRLPYRPATFGIGFRSDEAESEAVAAEQAASELGVPHKTVAVDDDEYVRAWPKALAEVGEPVANSGGLLVGLLCGEVGRTHKVVLTGQGADEPLGGYPRHAVERLLGVARLVSPLVQPLAGRVLGAENGARLARALAAEDRVDRYVQIFSVMPPTLVDELVVDGDAAAYDLGRAAMRRWVAFEDDGDTVNELLRIDARMSLADDLLLIADHFSMRSSVELRVPFLDLEFLQLVERMPSRYKISRLGGRKWLYRQAALDRLPERTARRLSGVRNRIGKKRGFSTPLSTWFESPGGLLATRDRWLPPLLDVPALSRERVAAAVRDDTSQLARQRAVLYSLSMWFDGANRRDGRTSSPSSTTVEAPW